MFPGVFMLAASSQSWLAHGIQEVALTPPGAWTIIANGVARQALIDGQQGKSSKSRLVRQEKEEAPAAGRPLGGERLAAFCFMKKEFHRFYKVTPTPPHLVGANNKTCAVVSNSGALSSRESGKDIDAHDIVFRFNKAPTEGFEDYVGSKTDYRVGGRFPKPCEQKVCRTFPTGESFTTHRSYARISHLRQLLRHNTFALSNQTEGLTSGFHGMLHA